MVALPANTNVDHGTESAGSNATKKSLYAINVRRLAGPVNIRALGFQAPDQGSERKTCVSYNMSHIFSDRFACGKSLNLQT
ncbi:hypothetical protein N7478_004651 [Penicillium angulare]|uniref:uncharacterized protein n=1 Tax=Penicillium angulare TaxID=116970 RepID=UPI0025425548|nr:uncharacterized protein N7478_004651 [Penicillium angulare]KAJ5279279.1 hypothetical protein N7478_004651 [Penicillium angulare]